MLSRPILSRSIIFLLLFAWTNIWAQREAPSCLDVSRLQFMLVDTFSVQIPVKDVVPNIARAEPVDVILEDSNGNHLDTIRRLTRDSVLQIDLCSAFLDVAAMVVQNAIDTCHLKLSGHRLQLGRSLTSHCTNPVFYQGHIDDRPLEHPCLGVGQLMTTWIWVARPPDCGDTTRMIYREFVFPSHGGRFTAFDTLTALVHQLQVDTTICYGDTIGVKRRWRVFGDVTLTDTIGLCGCLASYHITVRDRSTLMLADSQPALCPGSTVMISAPVGFTGHRWSSGDTSAVITVDSAQELFLSAVDTLGCRTQSDTIDVLPYYSYKQQDLCFVTFDHRTGDLVALLNRNDVSGVRSHVILVESDSSYLPVDTIALEEFPLVTVSSGSIGRKSLKIGTIDSCGVLIESESPGAIHRPIFLEARRDSKGATRLEWQPYEGRQIKRYEIWQEAPDGHVTLLDTLAASQTDYLIIQAVAGAFRYHVKGVFSHSFYCGFDFESEDASLSNIVTVIRSVPKVVVGSPTIKIYPNPSKGAFRLEGAVPEKISVVGVDGLLIHLTSQNSQYDISHLPAGLYFVQVLENGDWHQLKLIKQ